MTPNNKANAFNQYFRSQTELEGSILGSLLFIMFINYKVKEIHSNIRLFAYDTSLYIVVDFSDSAAHILNMDLARLYNWAVVQWRVKFKQN